MAARDGVGRVTHPKQAMWSTMLVLYTCSEYVEMTTSSTTAQYSPNSVGCEVNGGQLACVSAGGVHAEFCRGDPHTERRGLCGSTPHKVVGALPTFRTL